MRSLIRWPMIMCMFFLVLIGIFVIFNCNLLMPSEDSDKEQDEKQKLCLTLRTQITKAESDFADLDMQYGRLSDKLSEISSKYNRYIDDLYKQQRQYSRSDSRYKKLHIEMHNSNDKRDKELDPIDDEMHRLDSMRHQKQEYLKKLKKKQLDLKCNE